MTSAKRERRVSLSLLSLSGSVSLSAVGVSDVTIRDAGTVSERERETDPASRIVISAVAVSGLGFGPSSSSSSLLLSSLELSDTKVYAFGPLPSEKGKSQKGRRTFTRKQGPESGPDCLICAEFARSRANGMKLDSDICRTRG